jgi:hypothetical protein
MALTCIHGGECTGCTMCQTPDEPQYRPPIFSREVSKEEVQEALKFIKEYSNGKSYNLSKDS